MKLRSEFFRYVIPSMVAFALSGIYAIADGFFVGNALGDHALAAINLAYPLTAFLQAVGTGIGMGGSILYTISMGSKESLRARQYFGMSVLLLSAASILFTIAYLAAAPGVLRFFGAAGEIHALSREYIQFIAYGAVFQIMGTGLVPFIRNLGGSIAAMSAMIAGFLTNIFLDYLFVWVLPWGMMGAAVATAIGQAVTLGVCLGYLLVKRQAPTLRFAGSGRLLLRRTLQVGLSPFGLTFSPNITLILINKSAAALGGAVAVTCYAPISYISAVILLLLQGISDGSQPLLSLFYGQGKSEETKKIRNLAYQFAAVVGVLCMAGLFLFRGRAAALFGASPQITQAVARILPVFLCGYLFVCISRVTTAYFYATNQNLRATLLIYGEPILLALALLILPNALALSGTWLSVPISQFLIMCGSLFFICRNQRGSADAPAAP